MPRFVPSDSIRGRQLAGAKMGNKTGARYPHSSNRQQERERRRQAARLAKAKGAAE